MTNFVLNCFIVFSLNAIIKPITFTVTHTGLAFIRP